MGGGVTGDFVVEVLPDIARDVWLFWHRNKSEAQLRDELQEVAKLTPEEAETQAKVIMAEEAGQVPDLPLKLITSLVASPLSKE